ncbi:MAG: hypothetical protein JWO12_2007 [Frankiales bacterium]|nr:hypothetical protein [Frankiales bacterium]
MYDVSLPTGHLLVDADEHRVEGPFHVFRRTTTLMGRPRTLVVRRLAVADVIGVTLNNPASR